MTDHDRTALVEVVEAFMTRNDAPFTTWERETELFVKALEAAGLVIVDRDPMERLISAASMLQRNSVSCVTLHHGFDIDRMGLPGWLTDTGKDIEAARALIAAAPGHTDGEVEG